MAVIKANAYGHGFFQIAEAATEAGASCLGVAILDEGLRLRDSGVLCPIVVLGASLPEMAEKTVAADLSATVSSLPSIRALQAAARNQGRKAKIHIKLETGMGRVGAYLEEAIGLVNAVGDDPNVAIEGIATHIGWTIGPQAEALSDQIRRFTDSIASLHHHMSVQPRWIHAANSLVTAAEPSGHFDLVRVGLLTYGISPSPDLAVGQSPLSEITPALSIHARLTQIRTLRPGQTVSYGGTKVVTRETIAAIVPVGYGDGYPRYPDGGGYVLHRGKQCPILGTVCMDQMVIDITDRGASLGDEVVLLGKSGDERLTAVDLARACGRISYEILTGLGVRLPYVYTP
jgi:alanine racemase